MKGELESLGEEVDENIESVSKIQTQILNLTHGKVNIFQDDGKSFRNIYDIYKDLANIWGSLDQTETSKLLEIIAGKNRSNQIQALISGWSDVEKAVEIANNAEGTAAKENQKYLDSIQGRLNSLTASWQALSNTVLSSDFVKFLVDGLSNLLNVLDKLTGAIGTLPTLGLFAGATAFIKNLDQLKNLGAVADTIKIINHSAADIQTVETALSGLNKAQMITVLSASKLSETDIRLILATQGLEGAELEESMAAITSSQAHNQLNAKVNGTTNAFKGLALAIKSHPIIAIAAAVLTAITFIAQAKKKADEAAEEAAREAEERAKNAAESAKSLKESLKDIEDYQKKVNDLSDTINNNNTSQAEALTARQQLLEIQKELIEKYGLEREVIDGITFALNGEKDALDGVKKSAAQQWLKEHQNDISSATDVINGENNNWVKWEARYTKHDLSSDTEVYTNEADFKHSIEAGGWSSWQDYYREPVVYLERWLDNHSEFTEKGYNYISGNIRDDRDYTEFAIKGTYKQRVELLNQLFEDIQDYVEYNKDVLSEEQISLYRKLTNGVSDAINKINNAEKYQDAKTTLNTAIENVFASNEELSDSYNKFNKAISDLEQAGLENNPETISQSVENLDKLHDSILELIKPDNSYNGVSGEVLREYIDKLYLSDATSKAYLKDYISRNDLSNILGKVNAKELTREGIKSIFSEFERAGEKNLSDSEKDIKKAIDDYISDYNSGFGKVNGTIDYSKLLDAMVDLGYLRTDTKKGYDNFSLSDYSDELDKLGDQVKTLKDAYDKFMEGKLTDEDIMKLITDKEKGFLELSDYVDDIGTGITTVAEKKINALINKLSKIDIETLNEKELASYNKFINYLYDLKSGFSDLTLQQGQFRSEMKKTYEIIENLTKFKEDLTKNGKLSASNLKTIEEDDTYSELKGITDSQKLSAAIEAFLTRAKKDYKALAESANEFSFNVLIRKAEEEIEKFEQLYDVDLSNWESLGEDKLKSWEGTSLQILSKQKKIIDEFKKTYSIDLREYKNMLEVKEALSNRRSNRLFMSNEYNEIRQLMGNDLSYEPMSGKVHYTGDDSKKAQVTQKLKSLGITWDDYIKLLNGGKLPDTFTGDNELVKLAETLFGTVDNIMSNIDWDSLLDIGKATDETKQNLDWIERRLKKFAQTTKEVYADVEKYTDFTGKNNQLNKSISAINSEIKANEDAYNAYMSAANAVNLSSVYKSKVQNGTLNIETIADADLRNKISEYQDLYDKALACKDAVESLKKTEKEYASQQLSNIESYYNAHIKSIQTDQTFYNSADTDNLNVKKNFDKLRELYQKEITETEKEAGDLRNTLNNLYSRGLITPEQYEEENEKIKQLNNSLRDTKKKVRDLADEELNYISNRASNRLDILKSESDLLVSSAEDPFYKKEKNYNSIRSNYRQQISIQEGLAIDLQKRLDRAVSSGEFEKFGTRWYEWIDKINEAKNNTNDLKKSIHELYSEELNDIKNRYETNIGFIDTEIDKIQSKRNSNDKIDQWKKESDYLSSISSVYKRKREELLKERNAIQAKFNEAIRNGLEEGSEIWNEWKSQINTIDKGISDIDVELNNITDSIRDLPIEKFARFADILSKIKGLLKNIQSFSEAQGLSRTSDDIYAIINSGNNELSMLIKERDKILSGMESGNYGNIGSEDWNEAFDKLIQLSEDIYNVQIEQEQEYDKLIDLGIDKLNKQKEEMQKQNDELEKRLSLEKAILALEKAKYQKNKLVYHEGLGFVYEADQNAIRDAQEELDKEYRQGVLDYFDKVVEYLEEYKKTFNIYNSNGTALSDLALSDNYLDINGMKYIALHPDSLYLKNSLAQLDPELAKVYSILSNSKSINRTDDIQNNLEDLFIKLSSNFANIQAPKNVQFIIDKDAIHLYGVNNTSELAQAIIKYLPSQVLQDLYKQ